MRLFTGKISYDGEDRFDITRKSGGERGMPFAPREEAFRDAVRRKMERRARLTRVSQGTHVEQVRAEWDAYAKDYEQWLLESQRRYPEAWQALLARPEVTIVCYCEVPNRCHRSLLARAIGELGAMYEGER